MFGFLTFGAVMTCLELGLKNWVETQDEAGFPRDVPALKGMLRLHRNHNTGFSFGVLRERRQVVETVPLCTTSGIAGIWLWLMSCRGRFMEKLALTLTLAGGVSNLYERMKRGYVVDYFSICWKFLKRVVLNLGDVCIFAGAVLYMVSQFIAFVICFIKERKS